MKKYVTLLLMVLLLTTACSTINTTIQDPTGRNIPNPHYVLQAVGISLTVTFYYVALKEIKDIDGSIVTEPEYLDFLKIHDIQFKNYKGMLLVIEVNNPLEVEYTIHEFKTIKAGKNSIEIRGGGILNTSDLKYRQFAYSLPYNSNIHKVDHLITISLGDRDIMRIGNFRYNIIN